MNRVELASVVADECNITKKLALQVIDATFDAIKQQVVNDEEVSIARFGKFYTKLRKAKEYVSFQDGTRYTIDEHTTPTFKYFDWTK